MARTRSRKTSVEAEEQAPPTSARGQPDEERPPPTPSFNGKISKFHYDSATVKADNASPASDSPRRTPKRTFSAAIASPSPATATPSPRPKKKRKAPSKYADPTIYAHLPPLVDILAPNLVCVCVGTNPGVQTATAGHAYAHPSNHFWKLMHSSGITDRRLKPEEDRSLPDLYCVGNTNIVSRPSANAAELSKEEMSAGTRDLDAKFLEYKPEAVLIVGKGIWEAIWRYRHGRNIKPAEFKYGWQNEAENMGKSTEEKSVQDQYGEAWKGSRVFVTTSTSGLAASLKPAEKEAIWKPFGEWVQKRRKERGFVPKVKDANSVLEDT